MKVLFFLMSFVMFSAAHAKLRTEAICRDEVNKILSTKLQKQFWWKDDFKASSLSLKGWKTLGTKPTTYYGYAYQKDKSKVFITEATFGKKTGTIYEVAEPKCQVKTSAYNTPQERQPSQAQSLFTDNDLAALVNTHPLGIVYVWSPGMPLSLRAIAEIKRATEAKKAHLTILMDPNIRVRPEHLVEIAKRFNLTENDFRLARSEYLFARGMGLHYPAAFLYTQGILPTKSYIGHKSAAVYANWIDLESNRLMNEASQ